MVDVLRRAGVEVDFPRDQTCCGQPTFNAGLRADARKIAEHTIRVFEAAAGRRRDALRLVRTHDPPQLCRAICRRSDLAAACQGTGGPHLRIYRISGGCSGRHRLWRTLGWPTHLPSHMPLHRGLGIDRQPRALLANVGGREVRELPEAEDCCGFGGIFSVEHPELSAEMLKRKIRNLEATQIPYAGGLRRRLPDAYPGRIASQQDAATSRSYCRSPRPTLSRPSGLSEL